MEQRDFELDGQVEGHLGLGFDRALQAVAIGARSEEQIASLVTSETATGSILAAASNQMSIFFLNGVHVNGTSTQWPGFSVVLVVDGQVSMTSENGKVLELMWGSTVVVPFAVGSLEMHSHEHVLFARPPLPV